MIPSCESCSSWWHWDMMALSGHHSVVWPLVQAGDRGWTVPTDVLPVRGLPHCTLRAPSTLSLCEGAPAGVRCAACTALLACLSSGWGGHLLGSGKSVGRRAAIVGKLSFQLPGCVTPQTSCLTSLSCKFNCAMGTTQHLGQSNGIFYVRILSIAPAPGKFLLNVGFWKRY